MKSIFSSNKVFQLILMSVALLFLIISCNNYSVKQKHNASVGVDSSTVTSNDSLSMAIDTLSERPRVGSSKEHHVDRNPASLPDEQKAAKGIALIYCPAKMIRNVPSIVNAAISRDDLSKALEVFIGFKGTIKQENPDVKPEDIARDTRNDTIDLYEKMEVKIEFDSDDFVQIGKDEEPVKEFRNKKMLEWQWTIKPIHSTQKSILNFKFYYVDPDNKENYILEKTISVSATVDARSYIDKWKDFLEDDSKTTITVILIPLLTYIGGFFSGKKKKS